MRSSCYACEHFFSVVTFLSLCNARIWSESSSFWAQWKSCITVKVVSCLVTFVRESSKHLRNKTPHRANGNVLQHFVGWLCDLWRKHRPPACPAYHMLCFLSISRDSSIGRAIEFGLEDWILARIKDIYLHPCVQNAFGDSLTTVCGVPQLPHAGPSGSFNETDVNSLRSWTSEGPCSVYLFVFEICITYQPLKMTDGG